MPPSPSSRSTRNCPARTVPMSPLVPLLPVPCIDPPSPSATLDRGVFRRQPALHSDQRRTFTRRERFTAFDGISRVLRSRRRGPSHGDLFQQRELLEERGRFGVSSEQRE